mmetsp:Transcript_6865/g.17283  ORF Transcript_6865/g.17283 Transcript_6865/m.17283 type:complete len:209 (+) Transcript_6865:1841-2467(+)
MMANIASGNNQANRILATVHRWPPVSDAMQVQATVTTRILIQRLGQKGPLSSIIVADFCLHSLLRFAQILLVDYICDNYSIQALNRVEVGKAVATSYIIWQHFCEGCTCKIRGVHISSFVVLASREGVVNVDEHGVVIRRKEIVCICAQVIREPSLNKVVAAISGHVQLDPILIRHTCCVEVVLLKYELVGMLQYGARVGGKEIKSHN